MGDHMMVPDMDLERMVSRVSSESSEDSDVGEAFDVYNFKSALSVGSTFLGGQLSEDSKTQDHLSIPFYRDSKGFLVGSFWLKSLIP
jgi:hypothetical protein